VRVSLCWSIDGTEPGCRARLSKTRDKIEVSEWPVPNFSHDLAAQATGVLGELGGEGQKHNILPLRSAGFGFWCSLNFGRRRKGCSHVQHP
jgi:hypothetical protein